MLGSESVSTLLTIDPRFMAGPQSSDVLARVVIHISLSPDPPDLRDWKKSVRPSADRLGEQLVPPVLTVVSSMTGSSMMKSAFADCVVTANVRTRTSVILVSILEPFQRLSLPRIGCGPYRSGRFHSSCVVGCWHSAGSLALRRSQERIAASQQLRASSAVSPRLGPNSIREY